MWNATRSNNLIIWRDLNRRLEWESNCAQVMISTDFFCNISISIGFLFLQLLSPQMSPHLLNQLLLNDQLPTQLQDSKDALRDLQHNPQLAHQDALIAEHRLETLQAQFDNCVASAQHQLASLLPSQHVACDYLPYCASYHSPTCRQGHSKSWRT